jgi:hypothetical protein
MKYLQQLKPPPIISIPRRDWYDADHPPITVRIRVFLAVLMALAQACGELSRAAVSPQFIVPLTRDSRQASSFIVWIRFSEPALRVLAAALVIQAAIWLAGLISPAYIEGGACAI